MQRFSPVLSLTTKILQQLSYYPLFESIVAVDERELKSTHQTLTHRTNIVFALLLEPFIFQSEKDNGVILASIVVFIWLLITRSFLETVPNRVLKERVRRVGPVIPTLAYALPEGYLIIYSVVKVFQLGGTLSGTITVLLVAGTLIGSGWYLSHEEEDSKA